MLAKVPRIITSWLPRREPYELKSLLLDAVLVEVPRGGESFLIEPAGEMWSVVTESPSRASTRAPSMSPTRLRLARQVLEERRLAHVGRVLGPGEAVALRHLERVPALVALEHLAVGRLEHLATARTPRRRARPPRRTARCR